MGKENQSGKYAAGSGISSCGGTYFLGNYYKASGVKMKERVYEQFSSVYPNLSRKTYDGVLELFSGFGYTASFGRDDVAKVFGVQRRRVGVILQYMVSAGVVVRDKRDTYRFVR